ncbi:MAG: hypothetical protein AB7H90_20255 [Alphaproteobacteria bacterium]
MSDRSLVSPVPLPPTRGDLAVLRKLKAKLKPLNDQVEEVFEQLIEDEKFNRYLQAVYDEQAVEGSLAADNIGAAIMIREKALELGYSLADEKWATISKALGVVLRRYGLSRKERKNTVNGEVVRGDRDDE